MTKEAIEEFLNEVNTKLWVNDKRMQDYARKNCSDVFKTAAGFLIEFVKPDIKKHFCFGYGYSGISTEEDYQMAAGARENAKSNEQYFIDENMEQFKSLEDLLNGEQKLYLIHQYWKYQGKAAEIRSEEYYYRYPNEKNKIIAELTLEDIEGLKKTVESEKNKFMKRIQTYLKRYGLSKVHSWTYLVD